VNDLEPAGARELRQAFGIVRIALVGANRQHALACRAQMQTTGRPRSIRP
jgi:hypothetical protein